MMIPESEFALAYNADDFQSPRRDELSSWRLWNRGKAERDGTFVILSTFC